MDEAGIVRLGLVGAGRWGRRYIATVAAIAGARLALVASRNPQTRSLVACDVVGDWREALDPDRVDGVIVASPPVSHVPIARACVASGLPVLVEKPLAMSSVSARTLRDDAQRARCLVMVEHTHLFSAAFAAMVRLAAGLGRPLQIASAGGNWGPFRADVDALWDYGPHDVSMCLALLGAMPEAIEARAVERGRGPGGAGVRVAARLRFADESRADLCFGNLFDDKRRWFEVRGAHGALRYDDLAPDKLVQCAGDGSWRPVALEPALPLTRAVHAFVGCIARGDRAHESLAVGVRVVEVLERIALGSAT